MKLTEYGKSIMEWRVHHGFYTPRYLDAIVGDVILGGGTTTRIHGRDLMLGKLMLVVTELVEVYTAEHPGNFREELADTGIRILDISTALDIDIDAQIEKASLIISSAGDIMQMVVKLSFAAEAVRKDDLPNIARYLGEAFRLLQLACESGKIDLMAEMEAKMKVNWNRPIKHGKLCSL